MTVKRNKLQPLGLVSQIGFWGFSCGLEENPNHPVVDLITIDNRNESMLAVSGSVQLLSLALDGIPPRFFVDSFEASFEASAADCMFCLDSLCRFDRSPNDWRLYLARIEDVIRWSEPKTNLISRYVNTIDEVALLRQLQTVDLEILPSSYWLSAKRIKLCICLFQQLRPNPISDWIELLNATFYRSQLLFQYLDVRVGAKVSDLINRIVDYNASKFLIEWITRLDTRCYPNLGSLLSTSTSTLTSTFNFQLFNTIKRLTSSSVHLTWTCPVDYWNNFKSLILWLGSCCCWMLKNNPPATGLKLNSFWMNLTGDWKRHLMEISREMARNVGSI